MEPRASELDRLLRAAKPGESQALDANEVPFGFDTRVVAVWRSRGPSSMLTDVSSWFRRIGMTAVCIAAIATAGAYWQLGEADDLNSPLTVADSIGDRAIEAGALQ